jgi:hypothetical protein
LEAQNDPPVRKPGRPKGTVPMVDYTIRIPRTQGAYLTFLAKCGWGSSANAVAKQIITNEIIRLQTAGFHERSGTLPTELDDSADSA